MSERNDGAGEVARLGSYALFLIVALILFFDARRLPTTRWEVLGAGAFPQIVFGLLSVLCIAGIVDGVRKLPPSAAQTVLPAARRWIVSHHLVIATFALFGLYLFLLPVLGFSWATFGFLLLTQGVLAPRTPRAWLIALIIALVFSFGLNMLFAQVFNVFLPRAGA